MTKKTIVIFGASSRQGQNQVTQALLAGHTVRAVTRNHRIFARIIDPALSVVAADYFDETSLARACDGADGVFFQRPQLASPETIDRQVDNVGATCRRAGVKLAIYNSTMWAPDEPCGVAGHDHVLHLENRFLAHGVPTIVFRPALYMDNIATLLTKPALVREGVYRYSHRPGLLINWIALEDIARFMVAAVERPDLAGRRIRIGGPETLTIEETIGILSEVIGKPIVHDFVEPRQFGAMLADLFLMPQGKARDAYLDFFGEFYSFNNYAPQRPFEVPDMTEVLRELPIRQTTLRNWASRQDWSEESLARQADSSVIGSPSG